MRDRILDAPAEVLLALWSVVTGGSLIGGLTLEGATLPASVAWMPTPLVVGLAVTVGGGGLIVTAARPVPWRSLSREWRLERIGWVISASGWAAYGTTLHLAHHATVITTATALLFITTGLLRIAGSVRDERATREKIRAVGL